MTKHDDHTLNAAQLREGGENHQTTQEGYTPLTTQQGVPIADAQNSLRAGSRGPALLEDIIFREKLFHFDHERIPERVVHARGYGAHGFFENYASQSQYTKADLFQRPGERVPVFVRFSTVNGSEGSFDLARDPRGFAVKFYTQQGNLDIVGLNLPVFFIQDAIKFPDLIHAVKPAPDRAFPQAASAHDNFWDFISLTPESIHGALWLMSDHAIPRSYRFMQGFGVHSFRFINAEGESTYVKYHFRPKLGSQAVIWNEAVKINGADPDFHRRDLWQAIENGQFPEWELGVQLFDEGFAEQFEFDILDPTKLIPEERVPITPLGRLVLNRLPDNFFAETEQVAFCTQNIVPGIDFTNDPLLQGRNFSYLDTQIKRLGSPNFAHIPINAPKCPFSNFQQDGHMAMHNPKGRANYEPNSWGIAQGGPREAPNQGFVSYAEEVHGKKIRYRPESFGDHYSQPRQFYKSQNTVEQKHIIDAFSFELSKCTQIRIRARVVSHLLHVDETLAKEVAHNLNLVLPAPAQTLTTAIKDLPPSLNLSILNTLFPTFEGRKLGIFITDGIDTALLTKLEKAIKEVGGVSERVALKVGGVIDNSGILIPADHQVDGAPSALFDAVALLTTEHGANEAAQNPTARDFCSDAYAHYKFIGYSDNAKPLLQAAGILAKIDEGFSALDSEADIQPFINICKQARFWGRPDGA